MLIRACGEIESCIFVSDFSPCLLQQFPVFPLPCKGTSFLITQRLLGSSGELEGVVKVLTGFSEATDMAAGSRSGVYQALLCGRGLSPMVMGGR